MSWRIERGLDTYSRLSTLRELSRLVQPLEIGPTAESEEYCILITAI